MQVKAPLCATGPHLCVQVFCFKHEVCKALRLSLQLGDATEWGRVGQEVHHRVGQEVSNGVGQEVSSGAETQPCKTGDPHLSPPTSPLPHLSPPPPPHSHLPQVGVSHLCAEVPVNVLQQVREVLHSVLVLQLDGGNHCLHRGLDHGEEKG